MPAERLQKLLARAGVASRREAERLVIAGRVSVNGRRAEIGQSADLSSDRVEVDGAPIGSKPEAVYFAVHKPAGMLSSVRDERGRRSVVRLIRDRPPRLWPAGRLDADSEGLMILTNDGDWANRTVHPRYGVEREYAVLTEPEADDEALRRLLAGVVLEDGPARLLDARRAEPPVEAELSELERRAGWVRVVVGEGRKREVRRLFEAVGCRVRRLIRTRLGAVSLDGLRPGGWRGLDPDEIEALTTGAEASR